MHFYHTSKLHYAPDEAAWGPPTSTLKCAILIFNYLINNTDLCSIRSFCEEVTMSLSTMHCTPPDSILHPCFFSVSSGVLRQPIRAAIASGNIVKSFGPTCKATVWKASSYTDTVLLCAQDYEFTPYIAELFNTLTNITYSKPCLCPFTNLASPGISRADLNCSRPWN